MIKFELSDFDWRTSKQYWSELKKQFINPGDAQKVKFIDRVLFESSGVSAFNSHGSATTTVLPSINSLTEMMNEIDKESKDSEKHDIDVKTHQQQETTEKNYSKELRQFIRKPVKCVYHASSFQMYCMCLFGF